ncbi:MAG: PD-(D/E)XK nuclease family protein [Clostridia bacterium]
MDIYLGKKKTGKSKCIYNSIDKALLNEENVILFVPSQARVLTETNYMLEQKKDGIIGVNITTISAYIEEKMKGIKGIKEKLGENIISKQDRKILLMQVINKYGKDLKIFKKVIKKEGFLDIVNIYIDIMSKNKLDLEKIASITLNDKKTEYKLKELAFIYKKYLEALNKRFLTTIDLFDTFIENILEDNIDFKNTKIYFDGYNNFTKSEYEFINSLIKKEVDTTIAITTDITSLEDIYVKNTSDIFEASNMTYKKLLSIVNENGGKVNTKVFLKNHSKANKDLVLLANNIFYHKNQKYKDILENIDINIETNKYSEIEKIAKKIKEEIIKGYRYKDFCIYTTNIDEYESIISRCFYEYDIPFFADTSKTAEISKLTKYIAILLEIAVYGMTTDRIFEILKLGLNKFELEDIYIVQNYIQEFGVSKYALLKEFKLNNKSCNDTIYDLERLNTIRINIERIFNDFIFKLKTCNSAKDIVKVIYEHLTYEGVFEKYEGIQNIEISEKLINIEVQVWPKICEIFNSISKIYEKDKISILEFYKIFEMAIKDTKLKGIPPTKDEVELIDINVSKVGMKRQVFFIGVNENAFPKKVEQDIIFADLELNSIEEKGLKLKETSLCKLNMQLYNIYEALNNICDKLYISIPASDIFGKALRKSSFLKLVQKVSNVKINGSVVEDMKPQFFNIKLNEQYSKNKAFDGLYKCLKSNIIENTAIDEKEDVAALYSYFSKKLEYKKIMNYKKDDENLDDETVKLIFSDELKTSVSRLELFKKCPFSYFMQYTLNIKPEKRFEVTSMDLGSFMHNVLEEFSNYLFNSGLFWQEILESENKMHEKYEEVLLNIINTQLEYALKKHKDSVKYNILKQKLTNTLTRVMIVIARGFNQSAFVPFGYEIEFRDGALFAPIKIQLKNTQMYLVGKIDRIDILQKDDKEYIRVVDYKSSSKDLNVEKIRQGLSLQLITYLTAFMENMEKEKEKEGFDKTFKEIIPAAMLYFNLSDKIVNLKDYTKDEQKIESEVIKSLRMKGIFLKDVNVIEAMDNKLDEPSKRMIDITRTTLKSTKNNARTIDKEEFKKLCDEAKVILKGIGEEIMSGVVKIRPNKKTNSCEYCQYKTTCRKNISV